MINPSNPQTLKPAGAPGFFLHILYFIYLLCFLRILCLLCFLCPLRLLCFLYLLYFPGSKSSRLTCHVVLSPGFSQTTPVSRSCQTCLL